MSSSAGAGAYAMAARPENPITVVWAILSHSGTESDLPLRDRLRSEDFKPNGVSYRCYRPPGWALTGVSSSTIIQDDPHNTVTNGGMTLTVLHNAACTLEDQNDVFESSVQQLQILDRLAEVTYVSGGQVVTNSPGNKMLFIHPMKTDPIVDKTKRLGRVASGFPEYFPTLGMVCVSVYYTNTGKPVEEENMPDGLIKFVLGRHCNIERVDETTIKRVPRTGITQRLFETLRANGLPEYYLDGSLRSEIRTGKNLSDYEIFWTENGHDILEILRTNRSDGVITEEEFLDAKYILIQAGVSKRLSLYDVYKMCKALSPKGTTMCKLVDNGCRYPFPSPPLVHTVTPLPDADDSWKTTGQLYTPSPSPAPPSPAPPSPTKDQNSMFPLPKPRRSPFTFSKADPSNGPRARSRSPKDAGSRKSRKRTTVRRKKITRKTKKRAYKRKSQKRNRRK